MSVNGRNNRDLQDYPLVVPANGTTILNVTGEFFNVVECDLDSFLIGTDQDPKTFAKKGTKRRMGDDENFKALEIDNSENGSALTIRIVVGFGDYTDGEVEIGGTIDVALSSSITGTADVSITAASTVQVIAANTSRKEVWISNLSGNTQTMRLAGATAAAALGFPLAPGATAILDTTAAIYAYNPGGAAESLAVVEF